MASQDMPREAHATAETDAGMRLDAFVARFTSVGSRTRARKAIETGKVTIDGDVAGRGDLGRPLDPGAVVAIEWSRPRTSKPFAKARRTLDASQLAVIYEDAHVLALDKPAGLLTDAASREQRRDRETLFQRVRDYLRPQKKRPFIVHRIDRDTSGVVLVAKTPEAHDALATQFRHNRPERTYWVAVQGAPAEDHGTFRDLLLWDGALLVQRRSDARDRRAKISIARYRTILSRPPSASVLEVSLETGRRNQIRVQCQLRGFPLIGERLYVPEGWQPRGPELDRQALHALRLRVDHPISGAPVELVAALPAELVELEARIRAMPVE